MSFGLFVVVCFDVFVCFFFCFLCVSWFCLVLFVVFVCLVACLLVVCHVWFLFCCQNDWMRKVGSSSEHKGKQSKDTSEPKQTTYAKPSKTRANKTLWLKDTSKAKPNGTPIDTIKPKESGTPRYQKNSTKAPRYHKTHNKHPKKKNSESQNLRPK